MDTTWSSATRLLVISLTLVALAWLAVIANPLLQAVGIAALLGYLMDTAVLWMMRRLRMSRPWAAATVFILSLLLVIGIPAALGTAAYTQVQNLEADFITAVDEIETFLSRPVSAFGFTIDPQEFVGDLPSMTGDVLALLPRGSFDVLSSVTTNLLYAAAAVVAYYYFLRDGPKIMPWLVNLCPPAYDEELSRLVNEVDRIWGKFLRMQLLIFLILAVLAGIGTLLVVMLFRTGLLQWSFWVFIGLLLLVYTLIQQIDNFWLRPKFLGRQLRLHSGIVLIGMIGALALSGVLGALLVVPMIATAKVVGRYAHHKLLGLPPWPVEEAELPGEASKPEPDVAG
jgi:predicted PurR-regulated permease PerM